MRFPGLGISYVFNGGIVASTPSQYINAEGGVITRNGTKLVHTFLAGVSNLVVTSNLGGYTMDSLGAAGGSAGGGTNNGGAGGGAGGDVLETSFVPSVRNFDVNVGLGGAIQGLENGANGQDTTFETESGTEVLIGGGGGGSGNNTSAGDGLSGGSGGGMGFNRPGVTGLATGLGNNGGSTTGDGGGGGGGMDSAGGNCSSAVGGNGGGGYPSSISGTLKYYGSGGGGGSFVSATGSTGGNNTGGNGGYGTASVDIPPTNPVANSGSGGGGAGNSGGGATRFGSAGADGVVIYSYEHPDQVEYFLYEIILENNDF